MNNRNICEEKTCVFFFFFFKVFLETIIDKIFETNFTFHVK